MNFSSVRSLEGTKHFYDVDKGVVRIPKSVMSGNFKRDSIVRLSVTYKNKKTILYRIARGAKNNTLEENQIALQYEDRYRCDLKNLRSQSDLSVDISDGIPIWNSIKFIFDHTSAINRHTAFISFVFLILGVISGILIAIAFR